MPTVSVMKAADLAEGSVRAVRLPGYPVLALYNLGGNFYATDDLCTHGNASLAEGDIEGDEIVCPFHEGSFDIRSGEAVGPPCLEPIRTYPVREVDGALEVELPD